MGKKQERILGIDRYNLYNNKRGKARASSVLPTIFGINSKTRQPIRPIRNIESIEKRDSRTIHIKMIEKGKKRILNYQTPHPAMTNQILAKLRFIIVNLIKR